MAQSLSAVLVHLIFSTKQRQPRIQSEIEEDLRAYIGGVCRKLDCPALAIGSHRDHIHVLCALSRTATVAKLVEDVKRKSSRWIKPKGAEYSDFAWQAGYGAFSIGQSGVDALIKYIKNQSEHHKRVTFQDEYRSFLKKYKVDFDESYVWD